MDRISRRGFAAAVGGALLAGTAGGAAAAAKAPAVTVRVNGQVVQLPEPPLVSGGKVYLPVADVADAFGVPVTWNGTRRVLDIGASGSAAAIGFVFQGVAYAATGLQVRTYPGSQNTSTVYWIVQYQATNRGKQPVTMSSAQPPLLLIGPNGAEYTPDSTLSGPQPTTLNPGLTFDGYLVFDMPASAAPPAYALGFNAYRVTSSGFTSTRLSTVLPANSVATGVQTINATYALSGLWNSSVQELLVRALVRTNRITPDLQPANFDPTTSFWIVDFGIDNPGPGAISFSASDFALGFSSSLSIAPYAVTSLPGYVPPSNLQAGVTLAAGQVFNGAMLFVVPAGTPTSGPQLVVRVNGAQQAVALAPCPNGTCPPVQQ